MNKCKYDIAWVGKCNKESKLDYCPEHENKKCSSCGYQATHNCEETGQFVCGSPLCADCEHTRAEDGSNGGIGFYRTSDLPNGYKEHCKHSDQVYKVWYARKELG